MTIVDPGALVRRVEWKGGGKGKEPHWAAKEEEESSNNLDCSRHVSTQYSDSGAGTCGDHLPAGLEEGSWPGTENKSDIAEKEWSHSPVPAPSCSPTGTVSLRSPSQESEVLLVLEDTEQAVELWKDQKALSEVLVKITENNILLFSQPPPSMCWFSILLPFPWDNAWNPHDPRLFSVSLIPTTFLKTHTHHEQTCIDPGGSTSPSRQS